MFGCSIGVYIVLHSSWVARTIMCSLFLYFFFSICEILLFHFCYWTPKLSTNASAHIVISHEHTHTLVRMGACTHARINAHTHVRARTHANTCSRTHASTEREREREREREIYFVCSIYSSVLIYRLFGIWYCVFVRDWRTDFYNWMYFFFSITFTVCMIVMLYGQWAGPLDLYRKEDAPALHESPSYRWNSWCQHGITGRISS